MQLAGVSVPDRDVLELSGLLGDAGFDELAEMLLMALANERPVVSLTIGEREMIIRALDDPPESLDELSAVLLRGMSGGAKGSCSQPHSLASA